MFVVNIDIPCFKVGVLEHNRVLEVLENYYFSSTDKMRETLKNPREMCKVSQNSFTLIQPEGNGIFYT